MWEADSGDLFGADAIPANGRAADSRAVTGELTAEDIDV